MPLDRYREKRDFARTPEPDGGTAAPADAPRFVIQKHAASRLHYDFRLEMEGVLRSWAVPKGPSFDTTEKHLAVEVEDHPIEYGSFEGTIPAGEYGGGTVMLWDFGTYTPRGDALEMYRAGNLKIDLHGHKLEGGFALVRMKRRPKETKDSWLLIKERDARVRPHAEYDVLAALPLSAKTGRSMEEIAAAGVETPAEGDDADPSQAPGALSAPMPETFAPELATKVARVPAGAEWLHEIKLDGYRALVRVEGDDVRFFTRNGIDWTTRFAALVEPVRALGLSSAWLDGEVTVLMPDGRTSFGALTAELKRGSAADLTYHVFDLPYLGGYDLRGAPLRDRKRLLEHVLAPAGPRVRYVGHVAGEGEAFHRQTCAFELEGSVAKRADSVYRAGRGRDWQKRKCTGREDFVVVGYTVPSDGTPGVGALALAARSSAGVLAYAGRVGTGWNAEESRALRTRLEAIASDGPSLDVPAADRTGVMWVRPELAVEVAFAEWTASGVVRHASFEGVREDLGTLQAAAPDTVAGVKLTHPDKLLFAGLGVTKRELAAYYERQAEWMLPHLENRPLVLVRCPHGADTKCFYQKNTETGFPASIGHVVVQHDDGPVSYALAGSAEALVALVQLGVLEIHTWGSLADDVERPDRLILDLDPGPDVAWEAVRDAALLVREHLEALGATAFAKTTGGKGLHVVTPLLRTADWTRARDVAKAIAEAVAASAPDRFTTNPLKKHRQGRIFIDYMRNTRGATAVAAFSTRARGQAPVSVPIRWDELRAGVRSDGYDIRSVPHRLAALGTDPWVGYDEAAVDPAALARAFGLAEEPKLPLIDEV
ncbi:MAG: DNA ligase D [Coriobacteriia bacterium]|nr:DNA ligase D [Coriobacteriia bacterium]